MADNLILTSKPAPLKSAMDGTRRKLSGLKIWAPHVFSLRKVCGRLPALHLGGGLTVDNLFMARRFARDWQADPRL
jgi:hypothetical protein